MRRKRREPGAQCLCSESSHRHIGRCPNKVWGHTKGGILYKLCDECRLWDTDAVPRQKPRTLTPREDRPAPPTHRAMPPAISDPLVSDPFWREQF